MEGKYVRGIFFGRRKKSLEGHSKEHLLYLKEYCKMVIGGSIYESRWQECQREQVAGVSTRAKWLAVNGNSWRSIYGRNGRFLIFFTYLCIETGESCIIHTPY